MPIEFELPDSELQGFSKQAQRRLQKATLDYSADLIAEANRITNFTRRRFTRRRLELILNIYS